ncbi:MAG: LarC family nickel insertion protein, partial [Spirochaetaceae bacterium]|nr:LarC family nickel insertion protein [Spirochaetaceae bacterium]
PVPAPATAYILKDIPAFGGNIQGELCTPTGAVLLKYFADDFLPMPQMSVQQIGYGMGKKDFKAANCVRVFLGESFLEVVELCCNLDDMTAEAVGFACKTLMDAGALDVFTTAVGMKKERPGILLTCICEVEKADMFAALLLKHTTTFGVRKSILSRYILERETKITETPFGKVRLKTGKGFGVIKSKLEYEDLATLAKEHNLSINEMEQKIWVYLNNQIK